MLEFAVPILLGLAGGAVAWFWAKWKSEAYQRQFLEKLLNEARHTLMFGTPEQPKTGVSDAPPDFEVRADKAAQLVEAEFEQETIDNGAKDLMAIAAEQGVKLTLKEAKAEAEEMLRH